MVAIKDWFGKLIKRGDLEKPQTADVIGLHRQFATHPSRGLTPASLAEIMQQAELGYIIAQHDLFADMEEKDAHIYAEMAKRKRALLGVEWDIVPPKNASATERKLAGYAKELMQDVPNFEDVILDALDGIGHGFSCQEIEWQRLGNEIMPGRLIHRPQGWFQTDRATRSELRLRDNSPDGQELWPFGWITHVHKAKSGYLSRAGLHRVLAWPYLFKAYSVGDLAEFLEIYGLPLRIGKYGSGAGEPEKAKLLEALVSIGHNAAGIIPEGMSIEFQEAAKGSHTPFEAMIAWCERSQSKAILGGTLTSQADGKSSTNALGNVHNEVRLDILQADATQLAGTFTRDLVYPLLVLNKGGINDLRRCPKFVFNTQQGEDISVWSDALPKLVGVGFRIKEEWAAEKLGIPQPEEGDRVLSVVPVNQPSGAPAVAANTSIATLSQGGSPGGDHLDDLVNEALRDWEAPMQPIMDVLQAEMNTAATNGETAEQFIARLPGLLGKMDMDALTERLTKTAFTARIAGEAGIQSDDDGR
ncbi:MAG: DUF935 domain-containing protein [Gallionella sp.]|nr:DUF935 domain-containing protein [Gallionella sp.]MDD4946465.1 DUF935 domain-containing protein [Gallionella sp.]